MRCGISRGIYTRVYTTCVIYMAQLFLAMEASYTIHENDKHNRSQYGLSGKCILANYVILSVTLYLASITTLTKVNGKHHAASN